MFALYVVTAIIGGVLILVSALGVHSADGGHDGQFDIGHGGGHDLHAGHDGDAHADVWIPFFSLRFWTYLATGFGVTGLLLTWFSSISVGAGAALAGATGLVAGLGVSYAMHYLRSVDTSSTATERDIVGADAKVLVALKPGEVGKVRCNVKGELIDLIAFPDDDQPIEVGADVMIVGIDKDRVRVVRRSMFFGD